MLKPDLPTIPPREKTACLKLLKLFKIEGQPADEMVTPGQLTIFHALVFQPRKRVQIVCSTQYGKSLITALALLVISCIQEQVAAVIAPTNDKAKIIMRYYIQHIGDHPILYSQLEKDTKLERLRQEESKQRIILRNGGGAFVLSVQAGNTRKQVEAAMGMGAKIVIQDESCLIPDIAESTVFRMIAGKGKEAFYCKIGNPFYRVAPNSHFYQSWRDPNYYKVFIDYHRGIQEGRYTQEFITEAQTKPKFDILFECEFPPPDSIDMKGYSPLVLDEDLDRAYVQELDMFGERRLGVDVAGGGRNYSTIVHRGRNGAELIYREKNPDTMGFAGEVSHMAMELGVDMVFVDLVGIGRGLYDRLCENVELNVVGVNAGAKPRDTENFINLRAEAFWRMREWLRSGGQLVRNEGFEEIRAIRYKIQSDKKVKIMSKEDMASEGIMSPDVADALMLTFAKDKVHTKGAEVIKPGLSKSISNPYLHTRW